MKAGKVLDSYALLAYLTGEIGSRAVRDALTLDENRVLMNDINVGEVYYIVARERGSAQADRFLGSILPALPIEIISNDFGMVIQAAKIKARNALAYADCFAVATAIREQAAVLTGDPEFKAVESLVAVEWID
jgi:predicted nucleic acid-binding protein